VTVPTLTVVPEPRKGSGTAPCAGPTSARTSSSWYARPADPQQQAAARLADPDFADWLTHIRPAAACVRPVRLVGTIATIEADTGRLLSQVDTATMPDGAIYKPCGNRRASLCPSCSDRYKRDAYQIVRAGLVGGKGVPESVASHPAVFATLTAPSFGPVHTRYVRRRHTCQRRSRCQCRAEPCHPRRDHPTCPHGVDLVCWARHTDTDTILGTAMCLDCYDYDHQVVWNLQAGELWRRTTIAINRYLRRLAKQRGIPFHRVYDDNGHSRLVPPFRLSFGKAAELQRRAVVHFHAIIRLDGNDPYRTGTFPPPAGLDAQDLVDAVDQAVATVAFTTIPHPTNPDGWPIRWGPQVDVRLVTVAADGDVTDAMVAAYLAKYATKSTENTGHTSGRLTVANIAAYADPTGTYTERLIHACWNLGQRQTLTEEEPWSRLRRWAHMLGFGGHFLTKSRRYSVTFTLLREQRVIYRRTVTAGPESAGDSPAEQPTTLVVNFLQFVGSGWHTSGDALLANTSAALAREHETDVLDYLTTLAN
jgi:hypothetical protein